MLATLSRPFALIADKKCNVGSIYRSVCDFFFFVSVKLSKCLCITPSAGKCLRKRDCLCGTRSTVYGNYKCIEADTCVSVCLRVSVFRCLCLSFCVVCLCVYVCVSGCV